ncbi:MAG: translation initiation factor IF-2 N-terminal domain-containing protein, partial [Chitinophagaceae bacterium]
MAETTTLRLMAAAKEFNIGKDTLVDFLVTKGFSKDDLKPTAKLTDEMYRALQAGFQGDKVAKMKSEQIDLPKAAAAEARRRRDEEDISFRKDDRPRTEPAKVVKKEEPAPVAVIEPEPVPQPEVEPQPAVVPEPEVIAPPVTEPLPETPVSEVVKIDAPELEGPKVIDKIDLSAIDSSTRPKKGAPKKAKATEEVAPEAAPPVTEPIEEVPVPKEEVLAPAAQVSVEAAPVETAEDEPVIENIRAEKLEGPKIMGKIELPVDSDTRPKIDEKRKRKRIPVEKKEGSSAAGFQRPAQGTQPSTGQGGGGRFGVIRNPGGSAAARPGGGAARPGGGGRFGITRNTAGPGGKRDDKQIDEKEIQRKIQETQAKLSGGGGKGGRGMKAKMRRDRRNEMADSMPGDDNKLQVTEFISVSELANLMDVSFAEVIGKCMSLGIMVSINQRLDAEVIELVASEFGYDVEFIDMEKQMEMDEEEDASNDEDRVFRSPIVTIMGHVDHGKTSLLDYIRNATVVAGEAGGITQHIGAYQVKLPNDKDITFLDTPGHEAFTAMRARGAKVTDTAVIVIAADDAIMPQTREAISHAQAANVPMIFAINKIDKEGANPAKIYEQLAGMNILVESWGGKFQSQEISAKQGLNIDLLLEKILLEAELLDLKANPGREASGTII